MVRFTLDETEQKTEKIHQDYSENLVYAQDFLDNFVLKTENRGNFKIKMRPCLDKEHYFLELSYHMPISYPLGHFAAPISFNQSHRDFREDLYKFYSFYIVLNKLYP